LSKPWNRSWKNDALLSGEARNRPGQPRTQERLEEALNIDTDAVFEMQGPLNLKDLFGLSSISNMPEHQFAPFEIFEPMNQTEDIFEEIKRSDQILHHPYDSFNPVTRLISDAARDPQVLSIKMTLYRTSVNSPIIKAWVRLPAAANKSQSWWKSKPVLMKNKT
jgi:polyphosphate kinase